jgi:hypothetical protein
MRTLYLLLVLTCLVQFATVTAQLCDIGSYLQIDPDTLVSTCIPCPTGTSTLSVGATSILSCQCPTNTLPVLTNGTLTGCACSMGTLPMLTNGTLTGCACLNGTIPIYNGSTIIQCICPINSYGIITSDGTGSCTQCPYGETSRVNTTTVSGCGCATGSYLHTTPTTYNSNPSANDTYALIPTSNGPSDQPKYQIGNFAISGVIAAVSYQYSDVNATLPINPQNYVNAYYLSVSNDLLSNISISGFSTSTPPTVFLADFDLDRVPDILLAGLNSTNNSIYNIQVWIAGNSDFELNSSVSISIQPPIGLTPVPNLTDVDGDGILDFVFTYSYFNINPSGLYVYVALGTHAPPYFKQPVGQVIISPSPIGGSNDNYLFTTIGGFIPGDVNNMLVASAVTSNGTNYVYQITLLSYNVSSQSFQLSTQSPNTWQFIPGQGNFNGTSNSAITTFVGFVDAPGIPYLIVGIQNILYIMSDFTNLNVPTQTITSTNGNFYGSPTYDLNNNGLLDIVATIYNVNVGSYELNIYQNIAGTFSSSLFQSLTLTAPNRQPIPDYSQAQSDSVRFVDANSDGVIDIVYAAFGRNGSNNVYTFFNIFYGSVLTPACISCPTGALSPFGATSLSACQCPANYYQLNVTSGCLPCPVNATSSAGTVGAAGCTLCQPNMVPIYINSVFSGCQCDINYYQINAIDITQGCTSCPAGSTSPVGVPDVSGCTCPGNQCVDFFNPTICVDVPSNTTNIDGFCTCDPGYSRHDLNISSGCYQCPENTFSDRVNCVPCPSGSNSSAGAVNAGECLCANADQCIDPHNPTACMNVPSNATNINGLCVCDPGYGRHDLNISSGCYQCPENTYSGHATCVACPSGSNSSVGAVNITQCICPNNTCLNLLNPTVCINQPSNTSTLFGFCVCNLGYAFYNSNPSYGCYQCPNNTYSDGTSCVGCPIGSTSPSGILDISGCVCPSNTYINGTVCASCPNNTFSSPGALNITGCRCPSDTYINGTVCISCPNNTFSSPGALSIDDCGCPSNTYINGTVCISCPNNTFSSAGALSIDECICSDNQCFNSTFICVDRPANTTINNFGSCACNPGYAQNNLDDISSGCSPCSDNTYSNYNNFVYFCKLCPTNAISMIGSSDISDCICPANFSQSIPGHVDQGCSPCPPGETSPVGSINSDSCSCSGKVCTYNDRIICIPSNNIVISNSGDCGCTLGYGLIGDYINNGCQQCPANTYSTGVDCVQCPANTTSPIGSLTIDACICPGIQCIYNDTSRCILSPFNTNIVSNDNVCTCLSGYSLIGNDITTGCHQCPANTYSNGVNCTQCPANTISSPGSINCTMSAFSGCPAGTAGSNCSPCPPGTSTNSKSNSTTCIPCEHGTYAPTPGSPTCTKCDQIGYWTLDHIHCVVRTPIHSIVYVNEQEYITCDHHAHLTHDRSNCECDHEYHFDIDRCVHNHHHHHDDDDL